MRCTASELSRTWCMYLYKVIKTNTNEIVNMNYANVFNTRGNIYKMQLTHMHYNLCKHFFSNRIIAVWNSLPLWDAVV